jgi:uncharacterized protein (TIGR02145 family)
MNFKAVFQLAVAGAFVWGCGEDGPPLLHHAEKRACIQRGYEDNLAIGVLMGECQVSAEDILEAMDFGTCNRNDILENPLKSIADLLGPLCGVWPSSEKSSSSFATMTDSRDKKVYRTIEIGDLTWLAENLNFQTDTGSWCYENKSSNCESYGRLYDWTTAMAIDASYNTTLWEGSDVSRQGVCPPGWHLPNRKEWNDLIDAAGSFAGIKLKSINWNGHDLYNFSALPGGDRKYDGSFLNAGTDGYWWTAAENGSSYAWRRNMYSVSENVYENSSNKSYGLSVRCVQN